MTQQSADRNSYLQDEVNKWVHFFPQPPDGFNPLTARSERNCVTSSAPIADGCFFL